MLPLFRVRRILPLEAKSSSHEKWSNASEINRSPDSEPRKEDTTLNPELLADGYIRMKKDEYEDLVRKQPKAALMYRDEDDGQVILVGSALELDQRLQEFPSRTKLEEGSGLLAPHSDKNSLIHAFDVARDKDVIDTWTKLDQRTREPMMGNKTQVFGQASPLSRNALRGTPTRSSNDADARRWASYSTLPASFDQKLSDLPDLRKEEDKSAAVLETPMFMSIPAMRDVEEMSPEELRWKAYCSQPRISTKEDSGKPIMSSTLQVPSTQKQQKEYQPLLELFQAPLSKLATSASEVHEPESNPSPYPCASIVAAASPPKILDNSTQTDLERSNHTMETSPVSSGPSASSISSASRLSEELKPLLAQLHYIKESYGPKFAEILEQFARTQRNALDESIQAIEAKIKALDKVERNRQSTCWDIASDPVATKLEQNDKAVPTDKTMQKKEKHRPPQERVAQEEVLPTHIDMQREAFKKQVKLSRQFVQAQNARTQASDLQKHANGYFADTSVNANKYRPVRPDFSFQLNDDELGGLPINAISQSATIGLACSSVHDPFPRSSSTEESYLNELRQRSREPSSEPEMLQKRTGVRQHGDELAQKPFTPKSNDVTKGSSTAHPSILNKWRPEQLIARRWIQYEDPIVHYEQYLVRWADRGPEDDTWYDVGALDCSDLLADFAAKHRDMVWRSNTRSNSALDIDIKHNAAHSLKASALHTRTARGSFVPHRQNNSGSASPLDCDGSSRELNLHNAGSFSEAAQKAVGSPCLKCEALRDHWTTTGSGRVFCSRCDGSNHGVHPGNVARSWEDRLRSYYSESQLTRAATASKTKKQPKVEAASSWVPTTARQPPPLPSISIPLQTFPSKLSRAPLSAGEPQAYEGPSVELEKSLNFPYVEDWPASQKPSLRPLVPQVDQSSTIKPHEDVYPPYTTRMFGSQKPSHESSKSDQSLNQNQPNQQRRNVEAQEFGQRFDARDPRLIHRQSWHPTSTTRSSLASASTWLDSAGNLPGPAQHLKPRKTRVDMAELFGRPVIDTLLQNTLPSDSRARTAPTVAEKPAALKSKPKPLAPVEPKVSAHEPTLWQSSCLFDRIPSKSSVPAVAGPSGLTPISPPPGIRFSMPSSTSMTHSGTPGAAPQERTLWKNNSLPRPKSESFLKAKVAEGALSSFDCESALFSSTYGRNGVSSRDTTRPPQGHRGAMTSQELTRAVEDLTRRAQNTSDNPGGQVTPNAVRAPVNCTSTILAAQAPLPHPDTAAPTTTAAAEKLCTEQLIEMGFPAEKAEPVAASVHGDLGQAIDVLDEDSRAWKSAGKRVMRGVGGGSVWRDPVPGSWDEELYG